MCCILLICIFHDAASLSSRFPLKITGLDICIAIRYTCVIGFNTPLRQETMFINVIISEGSDQTSWVAQPKALQIDTCNWFYLENSEYLHKSLNVHPYYPWELHHFYLITYDKHNLIPFETVPFKVIHRDTLLTTHVVSWDKPKETHTCTQTYMMVSSRELYLWISCSRTTLRGEGLPWRMDLVPS